MNFIKKAYCRVFQTCLWISLPVLPYREPEIIKSMRLIPETIKSKGLGHPIIITDKGIMSLGLVNPLIDALNQASMPYSLYDGTVANPTTQNVAEALELYKKDKCDCIIGFGGGSSMDCAKALGARYARPKKSLNKKLGRRFLS